MNPLFRSCCSRVLCDLLCTICSRSNVPAQFFKTIFTKTVTTSLLIFFSIFLYCISFISQTLFLFIPYMCLEKMLLFRVQAIYIARFCFYHIGKDMRSQLRTVVFRHRDSVISHIFAQPCVLISNVYVLLKHTRSLDEYSLYICHTVKVLFSPQLKEVELCFTIPLSDWLINQEKAF